jgi:L-rhamnose isomerase/sugar isomerase
MSTIFTEDYIASHNQEYLQSLQIRYDNLEYDLQKKGINIAHILEKAKLFSIAIPSWGVGTGGTRFARFPGIAEPRSIFEKLEDCAVIQQLTKCTNKVSPHFPWDSVNDIKALKEFAQNLNLEFDAINSNTFQDHKNQNYSYKYGSLTHTDQKVRHQAIEFNIKCIEYGQALGSKALTVWIGDGSNFPGQQHFSRSLSRYLDSMRLIYEELPNHWNIYIEHKMFEPSFYSTVMQDWGTNILCTQELGEKAKSLVDLGHHAPNVNIEMIVSRLVQFNKLGGFHFNDSKYGDDDLDSGSLHPYQQFLIFNELVDAEYLGNINGNLSYMLDQSHNVTDPIESLIISSDSVQRSYIQACLVDRKVLYHYQDNNDAIMASETLKTAFNTDVTPILQKARLDQNGAIEPINSYRSANYRKSLAHQRPESSFPTSGII